MTTTGTAWLDQIWKAGQVNKGNVVRRAKKDVASSGGGIDRLKEEVKKRRFHLVESGDQYLILCNKGDFKVHC